MRIAGARRALRSLASESPYACRIVPSTPAKFYVSPIWRDSYPHAHRPLPPLLPSCYTSGGAPCSSCLTNSDT